jgi:hypothetical protein
MFRKVSRMKMVFIEKEGRHGSDQWIPELGYFQKNGRGFLTGIVRFEEFLSGTQIREECVLGTPTYNISRS